MTMSNIVEGLYTIQPAEHFAPGPPLELSSRGGEVQWFGSPQTASTKLPAESEKPHYVNAAGHYVVPGIQHESFSDG